MTADGSGGRPEPVPYESKEARPDPLQAIPCSKCGGEMRQGVLIDQGQSRLFWVAGRIRRTWAGVLPPDGRRVVVVTYKCAACGYLESYGPPG